MKSQIALIRSRGKNATNDVIIPQLGLGYLSAYLKKYDYEPLIIDAMRDKIDEYKIVQIMRENNIEIAGLSCLSAYYDEVMELSRLLKENNIKVIIGGVHPTFLPYQTLVDSKADFVVCGEGEIPLLSLLENNMSNILDGGGYSIKGVYSLSQLKDASTPFEKADIVDNLDDLPFPDWAQIDPNDYPQHAVGEAGRKFPVAHIMSSRGCSFSCKFCSNYIFYDRRTRLRSAENVIAEMQYLIENFKVKEIHFADDNTIMDVDRMKKICNLMIEKKFNIGWIANGIRANLISEDLIKLMKKAGCYFCGVGVESANEKILQNVNKRESIKTIYKAIQVIKEGGIMCGGFFILGLPGETKETMKESIDFALNSGLDRANFTILSLTPGSDFHKELSGSAKKGSQGYTQTKVEWVPEGLTEQDISKAHRYAFLRFYLRGKIIISILKEYPLSRLPHLFKRFIANWNNI
ncbi:MAG: B12-binding domain-containing radical SAM protein [Elusimicrobiota bacterium]|jgi:radical SAM superfamily enzyme YgiQ (UPF0313 family)|nr:B12-binding domain-containing radical SAM protein [Elusimicrobiota bacterium]